MEAFMIMDTAKLGGLCPGMRIEVIDPEGVSSSGKWVVEFTIVLGRNRNNKSEEFTMTEPRPNSIIDLLQQTPLNGQPFIAFEYRGCREHVTIASMGNTAMTAILVGNAIRKTSSALTGARRCRQLLAWPI